MFLRRKNLWLASWWFENTKASIWHPSFVDPETQISRKLPAGIHPTTSPSRLSCQITLLFLELIWCVFDQYFFSRHWGKISHFDSASYFYLFLVGALEIKCLTVTVTLFFFVRLFSNFKLTYFFLVLSGKIFKSYPAFLDGAEFCETKSYPYDVFRHCEIKKSWAKTWIPTSYRPMVFKNQNSWSLRYSSYAGTILF